MWDPYAEFETAVLSNGLAVHVAHWPGKSWVKMGFVVHSGARHDEVGLEGTAHFVEHLVSRNTVLPYRAIRDFFDGLGGSVDLGGTSNWYTRYYFFVPAKERELGKALEIFGSMLLNSRLACFVEEQRQVILEEFNRKFPQKWRYDHTLRELQVTFRDNWASRLPSPLGKAEAIACIRESDLQAFYDTHYVPANMSIVCVGGLKLAEVVAALDQSPFAAQVPGSRQLPLSPLESFSHPTENRYVFEESKETGTRSPLHTLGYGRTAVLPGTINRYAVRMLRHMLSQVLFEEVREKRGWTYQIGVRSFFNQDTFTFQVCSEALSIDCASNLESVIEECIASLAQQSALFEQKRQQELVGYEMVDIDAERVRDNATAELGMHHRIITNTEDCRQVAALSMEDVQKVLEWIKPERSWTLIRLP